MARMKRMRKMRGHEYHIQSPDNRSLGFRAGDIAGQGDMAVDHMVHKGRKMGFDF